MKTKNIGYVITEVTMESSDAEVVGKTKSGKPIVEVILQDMNVDNRNGRYYADKDLVPELTSARMQELISSGNMKGENGHPMSSDIKRQSTIDPNNVCFKILKLWVDGNDIKAWVTGTNNQKGQEFIADILDGEKPSFSLRALGTIENKNGHAYVKNIKIITWDRVIYPSHKRAYMQKFVTEGTDMATYENGNKVFVDEDYKGTLIPITNDDVVEKIKQESGSIDSLLNRFDTLYESMSITSDKKNVQLIDKFGEMTIVNLHSHVRDSIMDYCYKK